MQNISVNFPKFLLMYVLGASAVLFLVQCGHKHKAHKHVYEAEEKTIIAPDSTVLNPFDPAKVGVGIIDGKAVYFFKSKLTSDIYNKKMFYNFQRNIDFSNSSLISKELVANSSVNRSSMNYTFVFPNQGGIQVPCSRTSRVACIPHLQVDPQLIYQQDTIYYTYVPVNYHPNHDPNTHVITTIDSISLTPIIFSNLNEVTEYTNNINAYFSNPAGPCANIAVPTTFAPYLINNATENCIVYDPNTFWITP